MPKITYSYIFNEHFNRVFECFADAGINLSFIFSNLISNCKIMNGNRFDKENIEFSFSWKNYYEFKMIVDKVVKENLLKSLTFRTIKIDRVPIQIILILSFYWDSIEEKTIYILELKYQDEFFGDLIENDFNENDRNNICKNVEKYLSVSLKGLEKNYSCLINTSLENAWKYVSHPKLFYETITKDLIYAFKEGPISIEIPIELFIKVDNNNSNFIPLTTLNVQNIIITSFYAQVTYITSKGKSFPSIKLTISIYKIQENKCFGSISVKPLERELSYEMYCNVFKFWQKRVTDFFHFFEKRSSKKK